MILPCLSRLSSAILTVFEGIANPIPCEPPLREMIAVLIPITSPRRLISGPPLLPGLIAAFVCRKSPKAVDPVRSPLRADNSVRYRLLESKRITDSEHEIARLHRIGIAQLERFDTGLVHF